MQTLKADLLMLFNCMWLQKANYAFWTVLLASKPSVLDTACNVFVQQRMQGVFLDNTASDHALATG